MLKYLTPIALTAFWANANPISFNDTTMVPNPDINGQFLCGLELDIGGIESFDAQGSSTNHIFDIFIGGGLEITAIEWDVNLSTNGASWASEATISIDDQLLITPAIGDDFTVSNMNYSSNGIIVLSEIGLPNITVGADGHLSIEFFESFDDEMGVSDAIWLPGSTITLYTPGWPTPGPLTAFAFAGLIACKRNR